MSNSIIIQIKLSILIIFSFVNFAESAQFYCDNSHTVRTCKNYGNLLDNTPFKNSISDPCPSNLMMGNFSMEIISGESYSLKSHHNEKNSLLKSGNINDMFTSYNRDKKYYLPNDGQIKIIFWDAKKVDKKLNGKFHNHLDNGKTTGYRSFVTTFMTQNNDIELNGNIEYQPDLGGSYPIFEINVKSKGSSTNDYIYKITGYCQIVGKNPFESSSNKSDTLKLFK